MIEYVSKEMRVIFVSLIVAIFACSMIFGYVFVIDGSISDDESKAYTFAAVFAAVFIILNLLLLVVGYMIFKKAKRQRMMRSCTSCGTPINAGVASCPECAAVQPVPADENTYLEPKVKEDTVVKKK